MTSDPSTGPGPTIRRLPSWAPMGGFALGDTIWLKDPSRADLIRHEKVHIEQQRRKGLWGFLWRYFLSPKWRVRFEIPAYLAGGYTVDAACQILHKALYLWCWPLGLEGIRQVAKESTTPTPP